LHYALLAALDVIREEVLMKFVYTSDTYDEIVRQEKVMLEK